MSADFDAQGMALAARADAARRALLTRLGAGLQRGRITPVMTAGAPTIVQGTDTTTITGGVLIDPIAKASRFTFLRASWVPGSTFPNSLGRLPNAVQGTSTLTNANGGSSPLVRFCSDAAEIEIVNRTASGGYRLRVDGQYVSGGLIGHNQATSFYCVNKFTWADGRKVRLYEVEFLANSFFGGVYVPPTATVFASPMPADEVRVVVHGDSFTEGALPTRLGQLLGQTDTRGTGLGGTGFINTGIAGRVKFIDRVQTDVIAPAPQLIVELGGHNDASAIGTDAALMQAPVAAWLDQVQAALPDTLIVVTGPMSPGSGHAATAQVQAVNAGKQAACAGRRNVWFVDNLAEPWVTGTGRVGNLLNNGVADWVTSSDATHPTDEGALYLAQRVARAVAGVVR